MPLVHQHFSKLRVKWAGVGEEGAGEKGVSDQTDQLLAELLALLGPSVCLTTQTADQGGSCRHFLSAGAGLLGQVLWKGFKIPMFKIPTFIIPMVQNTNEALSKYQLKVHNTNKLKRVKCLQFKIPTGWYYEHSVHNTNYNCCHG